MKILLLIMLTLFCTSVFAEDNDDLCGRMAPATGLSLIKAMNNVEKNLMTAYHADKVFYMCPGDGTWSVLGANKFPNILLINVAFILFEKETDTSYVFKILGTDEDYEHANYAEVNKATGLIDIQNL